MVAADAHAPAENAAAGPPSPAAASTSADTEVVPETATSDVSQIASVTQIRHPESSATGALAARDELAVLCGQINDGHARLVRLMRTVIRDDLWNGGGIRSPEHWLTAFAGLTWASASDVVRIAQRSEELPTMARLIDEGRLTLGQAAVVSKYTPSEFDADVAEFASFATVTQLRRALSRYAFYAETQARHRAASSANSTPDSNSMRDSNSVPDSVSMPDSSSTTSTSETAPPNHADPTDATGRSDTDQSAGDASSAHSPDASDPTGVGSPGDSHEAGASDASDVADPEGGGSAFLTGDDAADPDKLAEAIDRSQSSVPRADDPGAAPPRLEMRYADGRFKLTYDAPADIGALVEQALLEAKDALFRLTDSIRPFTPDSATTKATAEDHESSADGMRSTSDFGVAAQSPVPDATPDRSSRVTADSASSYGAGDELRWRRTSFADALLLMAQRSLDHGAPPGSHRSSRYRVYLHLDVDGHAWLGKGAAIPPSLRDRVICDGVIQPIWEREGRPVSVGRSQRIVPDRTRHLIEDRDRGCRYPGCLATHHLEAHHLDHWIDGGRTDAERMLMLCSAHHDAHHRGEFTMVGDPGTLDGVVFCDRHGSPIRPLFAPYGGTHPMSGTATDGRDRWTNGESCQGVSTSPPSSSSVSDSSALAKSGAGFGRYAGPANDPLHLAWVRFEPAG